MKHSLELSIFYLKFHGAVLCVQGAWESFRVLHKRLHCGGLVAKVVVKIKLV